MQIESDFDGSILMERDEVNAIKLQEQRKYAANLPWRLGEWGSVNQGTVMVILMLALVAGFFTWRYGFLPVDLDQIATAIFVLIGLAIVWGSLSQGPVVWSVSAEGPDAYHFNGELWMELQVEFPGIRKRVDVLRRAGGVHTLKTIFILVVPCDDGTELEYGVLAH